MLAAEGKEPVTVNTYAYSPRGVRILAASPEPVAQPYCFAGDYQDFTGPYHFAVRYYDANVGRFTSPDPSGQEKNPYLYVEGDPVNRIGPHGTLSMSGVADALGPVGDVVQGGVHLAQWPTRWVTSASLSVSSGQCGDPPHPIAVPAEPQCKPPSHAGT
jgi:RHS repeat-associated protein